MPQTNAWEQEYQKPRLMTGGNEPQSDVKDFFKFLKKKEKTELTGLSVLDLGSGTGRNSNFLAQEGNKVVGMEISKTATEIAKTQARELGVSVDYQLRSIGEAYPYDDNYFDLILDVTSSNSLNEKEREVYLLETKRVLKSGGYFFIRALCKDGDQNAKNLIKLSPGVEYDTYINKDLALTERVWTEMDFKDYYSKYFTILELHKKTSYTRFEGQSYKRNYWCGILKRL